MAGEVTNTSPKTDRVIKSWFECVSDQLDLDSMDLLNFIIGLHKELHVDIPEVDYPKLTTLADLVDYLTAHQKAP